MAEAEPNSTLVEEIRVAFDRTGRAWLQRLAVEADGDGEVILRGTVPTFYLKQLAQVIVLGIPGVTLLRNQLQVIDGKR